MRKSENRKIFILLHSFEDNLWHMKTQMLPSSAFFLFLFAPFEFDFLIKKKRMKERKKILESKSYISCHSPWKRKYNSEEKKKMKNEKEKNWIIHIIKDFLRFHLLMHLISLIILPFSFLLLLLHFDLCKQLLCLGS